MKNNISRIGICIALSYILGLFDIVKLPYGGGVSLESLPLMIFAYISGPVYGSIAGFIYGLLMLTKPSLFIHPLQFLLDYPLAFSSFFIIGFIKENNSKLKIITLAFLAFALRYLFHCLSGIIFCSFFLKEVPENIFTYVIVYNISYLMPTALISVFIFTLIAGRLKSMLQKIS